MPYVMQSPEDWFRQKGKDIYVFDYRAEWDDFASKEKELTQQAQYRRDVQALKEWCMANIPNVPCQRLCASEYSGWIEGGPTYLAADLDEAALAQFNATWDHPGSPWCVETFSYADWLGNVHSCRLLPTPLAHPQRLSWWDAPSGFVLLGAAQGGFLLSRRDAWWRLPQLVPGFEGIVPESLPYGEYHPDEGLLVIDPGDPFTETWRPDEYEKNAVRIALLREALGITPEQRVHIVVGD